MKTIASPAPRTVRARSAGTKLSENAKPSWPAVMSTSPESSIRRGPNRSRSTPTGTCIPAYTAICSTVNAASSVARISKRSAATSPATPSELRLRTART
jgi:hypothetical protein